MKILIVDEERESLDFFSNFLTRQGYKISATEDGFDALNKIGVEHYDVIITGVNTLGMSGIELLERINELKTKIIKIIVSGYFTDEVDTEAKQQGCVAYLTKPIDLDELESIIKKAFKKK